jgi:16S rRNA (guanine527-N7)-methyltransferase
MEPEMGAELPEIGRHEFGRRLADASPEPLAPAGIESLYQHYQELRRWNPTLSLVGPGTAAALVERHYGESLAALPLLPAGPGVLLDLGSGAGFPGVVLAAVRPRLRVVLAEARERKWAFLMNACRRAALPCECLNARVAHPLPAGLPSMLDVITVRALKLPRPAWEALRARLSPDGRILRWTTAGADELPIPLRTGRRIALPGTERREVVELLP